MEIVRLNKFCQNCIMEKYSAGLPESIEKEKKEKFAEKVKEIIYSAKETVSPPEIVAEIDVLKEKMFGIKNNFRDINRHFNSLILSIEEELESRVKAAEEPLKAALKYSMMGNYIDFGAMDSVNEEKLFKMLQNADDINLSKEEVEKLKEELCKADRLVFITDNCGEIVFDKILIKIIKNMFPGISVSVIVRGFPALNDATMEDAGQIGLTEIAYVTGNGTAIAGTCLHKISAEALDIINGADVIIAKGQGNFETLRGCKKNIYYAFMCKCEMFSRRFSVPQFTGMFINDLRTD